MPTDLETRTAASLVLFARAQQLMPGGVNSPVRAFRAVGGSPRFIGRGAGDCEDFSIAKYITLQMLGIGNDRLRLIYVRARIGSTTTVAHMVLGFYPQPTDEPLILDNLISSVRPASMRSDLAPVFSFNSAGLWVGGGTASMADPTTRLSRWRDVLDRMRQEGLSP